MALRTGATVRAGKRPSRQEVQSAALQQLQQKGAVTTPTEDLGTVQETVGLSLIHISEPTRPY